MNAHKIIQFRLAAAAPLIVIVDDRIYATVMKENAKLPAVTYQQLSIHRPKAAITRPGLAAARFNISSWAKSAVDARKTADQVRVALDRMRRVTVGGVAVDDCFFESDLDLYESETKTFYVVAEYELHFRDIP